MNEFFGSVSTCLFHFTQAVMKNVSAKGAIRHYRKKRKGKNGMFDVNDYYCEEFRRNVEYILCLPFVPINLIEIVWFGISRNLMELGRTVQYINEGNMVDFCSYFTNQWVDCEIYINHKAKIPPLNWFVSNIFLNSNNPLEGINSEVKKNFQRKVREYLEFWKVYEPDWHRGWCNATIDEDLAALSKRPKELMEKYKAIQKIQNKLKQISNKQAKRTAKAKNIPNNYLSEKEERSVNDCLHQLAVLNAQARKNKYLDADKRKKMKEVNFDDSNYVGLFDLNELNLKDDENNESLDARKTMSKNDKKVFAEQMDKFLYKNFASEKSKSQSTTKSSKKPFKVDDSKPIQ